MARKPSQEALEKKVRELQKEAAKAKLAEQTLQECEKKFRTLCEASPDGILVTDIETRKYQYANPALCKLLGYSEEEIADLGISDVHPKDELEYVVSQFEAHVKGEITLAESIPFLTKDGTTVYVDITGTPAIIDGKRCSIGFLRDITERKRTEEALRRTHNELGQRVEERTVELMEANEQLKQEIEDRERAQQALRESQERYKELWDEAPVAYHVLDTGGIIKRVNHTEADMLGYTREEMVGRSIFEFIMPEQRQEAEERFRLKLAGEHIPKQHDRVYVAKDGSKLYVSIDDRLEFGSDGEVSGVRTTMVDMTQQKRAQEALRESEEKYRNVVERSNDGIVIVQDGVIKYANPKLAKMTGYDTGEGIGTPFTSYVDPDEVEQALDYYRQRMAGEPLPARYERGLRHKNGSRIDTEIDAAVITYKDRPAVLVIIRDITDRKRAEEALKSSSEKIKLFAYSVSHDLKSPAVGIYGLTRLLYKHYSDILDERGKNYCDQISKAAEQIAALAWNINVYISTKEVPLSVESVKLEEILQMIRDEFSSQLDVRQIQWFQPESMPEIRVDRLSILRVLRNLVDNALKHGGDDLSEITIGYEGTDEFHTLSVGNDGVGIKQEDCEKIFGPFQRHERSTDVEGSGLGLTIVKEVAEQHGGRVWVESGPEDGPTFYISISKHL